MPTNGTILKISDLKAMKLKSYWVLENNLLSGELLFNNMQIL